MSLVLNTGLRRAVFSAILPTSPSCLQSVRLKVLPVNPEKIKLSKKRYVYWWADGVSEILTSFRINLSLFGEKSGGDLWSGKGSLTLSKTGTDVRRHGLARGCPGGGSRP